jgi:large conductance mechanosensitive channel
MAQPKKSLIREFRDFIWSGNLIEIAVALILALKLKDVIDAFMGGVVNPIIGAILQKQDFTQFGFDLGKARISLGGIVAALINLVVVGAVLFVVVKIYTAYKKTPDDAGGPTETELLAEIRDLLRQRQP